tara:strand:+ start:209 stop:601 length:393 start_codon:yes stop_codon:yes gene_type:complete
MPKPKPDQVIRYEVVLGSVERQIIKDLRTAYAFNKVADPVVRLMNDVTGVAVFLSLVSIIFDVDIPYFPDQTDLNEIITDYNNYKEANKDIEDADRAKPTNLGSALYNLRNPNWNFSDFSFDSVTGGIFD